MPEHRVGTHQEWQAERDELLTREKELTRLNDELAERRQQLPWVPVEKEYSFETEDGAKSLADLFEGYTVVISSLPGSIRCWLKVAMNSSRSAVV